MSRVAMHLQFAAGYRAQVKLDRDAARPVCAEFCEQERRRHQRALADIRTRRGAVK